MSAFGLIASVTTVLSFLAFAVVVWWACGKSRADRFAAAAELPFALPDESIDSTSLPNTRTST